MRYAIIENGKVANITVAEPDFASDKGWVPLPDNVGIGWDYANDQFLESETVEETPVTPAPTKEELLAQLQALQAQIQSLE